MEEPYSNREIREFIKDIKTQLDRIEGQTTRTNGRVTKLENWRWYITGGLAISALVILPTIAWIISNLITIKS